MVEPLETYNLMKTLFTESCPSLIPQAESSNSLSNDIQSSKSLDASSQKDKYICKGLDACWHAHQIGQYRRPLFKSDGELAYLPIPCGRQNTCPSAGVKNCHNGNQCSLAHSNNEVNFHPYTYRTVPCQKSKNKCTVKYCPFYHKKSEKRDLKKFLKLPSSVKSSSRSDITPDQMTETSTSDISAAMSKNTVTNNPC